MDLPVLDAEVLLRPGEAHPEHHQFVRMHFDPEKAKGTVWHYTDATGLLGILNSGQLWATASLALNDASEVSYGERLIRDVWAAANKDGLPEACRRYTEYALDFAFDDFAAEGLFSVSASLDGDLLSQWRSYGGADGFAIGIDAESPLAPILPGSLNPIEMPPETAPNEAGFHIVFDPTQPPSQLFVVPEWSAVRYDLGSQYALATAVLQDTIQSTPGPRDWEERIGEWPSHVVSTRSYLLHAAALMKHPAFVDEREVRLLCSKAYVGDIEEYRAREGRLVPYVPIAMASESHRWFASDSTALPIVAVRYGPASDARGLRVAASLLARRGYADVSIDRSSIPIAY